MNELPPNYYENASSSLVQLVNRLIRLLEKLSYSYNDSRCIILIDLIRVCQWGVISIEDFIRSQKDPSLIMNRLKLKPDEIESFFDSVHQNQRGSFLVMFLFYVETLFKKILKEIENNSSEKHINPKDYEKYYVVCQTILKITHKKDINEKQRCLRFAATIRNTLHSGGVHTKDDITYTIRGRNVKFERGIKAKQTGWDTICVALDVLVDVLEEILFHPDIKNIDLIMHSYE